MSNKYSVEDRLEACMAWIITGNSEDAASMCASGVTGRTIREWMNEPWWEDILEQAKDRKQKELDAIYTGLIHKATTQLRDRLNKGDEAITKDGAIINVAIKAKDLAFITSILADRRAVLRGQASKITKNISAQEKLNELRKGFEHLDSVADTSNLKLN